MTPSAEAEREILAQALHSLNDETPDGELEAACLVAQALESTLDLTTLRAQISELCDGCDQPQTPWLYLRELGFQGGGGQVQTLTGSRLDSVLSSRSGLPITLGVLLITLARTQGRTSWGVNFPGHFLVRVDSDLIDPFEMSVVREADCLERLTPAQRPAAFARATPRLVALRMLNNLKYQFAKSTQWHQALAMLDFQLAMVPDDASLLFERGGYWLRLGAVDVARASLESCLQLTPGGSELARLAHEQLAAIAGQHNTLH